MRQRKKQRMYNAGYGGGSWAGPEGRELRPINFVNDWAGGSGTAARTGSWGRWARGSGTMAQCFKKEGNVRWILMIR